MTTIDQERLSNQPQRDAVDGFQISKDDSPPAPIKHATIGALAAAQKIARTGRPGTMAGAVRPVVKFLRMKGAPLLKQLQLEEALLRADQSNWWILNDGAPEPTVVLGISGWVWGGASYS